MAPWSHPWSVAPPQGSRPPSSSVDSEGVLEQRWCSGAAGALSRSSMDLILARMGGPDLLLRWAQPQRIGDRGQAGERALRTPLSRAWAATAGGALLAVKAVFVVHWFLSTQADVSAPCTAAVSTLQTMSGARRHPPPAGDLLPPPGVLNVCRPLGRKCGHAKAVEPVSPALALSKQLIWAPKSWQSSGQSCGTALCPSRGACGTTGSGHMTRRNSGFKGAPPSAVALPLPETQ